MANIAGGRSAPIDKDIVEVTDEMREAGVAAFVEYDLRFHDLAEVLTDVYRAMVAASRDAATG